ncbi:unnamed protein product, partial [marine sediment metagenome]
ISSPSPYQGEGDKGDRVNIWTNPPALAAEDWE